MKKTFAYDNRQLLSFLVCENQKLNTLSNPSILRVADLSKVIPMELPVIKLMMSDFDQVDAAAQSVHHVRDHMDGRFISDQLLVSS